MELKNNKPENPKVFPDPMRGAESSFINQYPHKLHEGIDLRDYFAAKAMQGFMGRSWSHIKVKDDYELLGRWAKSSYILADAMLKERGKNQTGHKAVNQIEIEQ